MAKYKIFSKSEEALYHNKHSNEDHYMFFEISLMNDEKMMLIVVADGMGGCEDSQQTSFNAIEGFAKAIYDKLLLYYMKREFTQQSISTDMGALVDMVREAFVCANDLVCDRGIGKDVGTTLSVVGIINKYAIVANIGDSPVYYYNAEMNTMDMISQLDTDAEKGVKEGKFARYSPEYHAISNILNQSLGQWLKLPKEKIHIDILGNIGDGDMILIGTDGAFGKLPEEYIKEIVLGDKEYQILDNLFKKARLTTDDDQTAILYKVMKGE